MVRPRQIGLNRDSLIQRQLGIAPVAQLDRASDYGSEGQEFESSRARQVSMGLCPIASPISQYFSKGADGTFVDAGAFYLFMPVISIWRTAWILKRRG